MADVPVQSLTIYLARSETQLAELINPDYASLPKVQIMIDAATPALLYIAPPHPGPPDWAIFFDGFIDIKQFGDNSSTSAVLLVEVRHKFFALTFGHGRFILNADSLEEKFGLKVALNCIGEGSVRSIQKRSLDQILRHSQEQASRDATPLEFGFDIEQDLLGGVTGSPAEKHLFGSRISGSESLHLTLPIQMNQLPQLLDRLSDKFIDTSYRSKFPWVDHISEVMSSKLQDELDKALIHEIAGRQVSSIWMAVPEIVQWTRISRFRFIFPGEKLEYSDIHLDNFLKAIDETSLTVNLLKSKRVVAIDENGEKLHQWPVYKCLYAEMDYSGKLYLLSGAQWYVVDKDFVNDVNAEYDAIDDYDGQFPEYQHPTEGAYLDAVAQSNTGYALMDQKFLTYPSKMEFCDLYTANRDICHIKKYGQSGVLSHLFAQALVSGELFRVDIKFREKVNEKLPASYRLADHTSAPQQGEYRIVFGIISDRPGALRIPFFSRLNFKHAVRRLEAYGYRVAKAKISVQDAFSKTAKAMKRKRKVK